VHKFSEAKNENGCDKYDCRNMELWEQKSRRNVLNKHLPQVICDIKTCKYYKHA